MQREHMVTDSMKQTKKEAGIGEELGKSDSFFVIHGCFRPYLIFLPAASL